MFPVRGRCCYPRHKLTWSVWSFLFSFFFKMWAALEPELENDHPNMSNPSETYVRQAAVSSAEATGCWQPSKLHGPCLAAHTASYVFPGFRKSRADRIWGHSPLCCRNLKVGVKPDSKHWGAIHENLGHYMYIFKFTERDR